MSFVLSRQGVLPSVACSDAFPLLLVCDVRRRLKLGEEKERTPAFLEKVVMPDDTLAGICLKYKASEALGRRI